MAGVKEINLLLLFFNLDLAAYIYFVLIGSLVFFFLRFSVYYYF